jgi:hypothetical protein
MVHGDVGRESTVRDVIRKAEREHSVRVESRWVLEGDKSIDELFVSSV